MSDDTPPDDEATRTRDGKGRYDTNPEIAKRRAEAARLRSRSLTYRQIAEHLGISVSQAHDDVRAALKEILTEPAEDVRKMELEKLDRAEAAVLAVLEAHHVTVSHGRLILDGDELPIPDHGPVLQAATALVRLSESRRKLLGLDAPAQVVTDSTVRYEVVGVDPADLT